MIRIQKIFVFLPAFLTIILSSVSTAFSDNAVEGVDAIHTDNYANTRLEYYYYVPRSIMNFKQYKYPLLVMIPGLSGGGKEFVGREFKDFATDKKFIIVAPSFMYDEKNWNSESSYQYPAVWSGNVLLDIIKKLKKRNNLNVSKLYLFGHSAGAQFALRFCLWKPKLCEACVAHAAGGTVEPDERINVKFFVTVGKRDTQARIEKARHFCQLAKEYGIKASYKEYPQAHELSHAQIKDSLAFFKNCRRC